MLDQEQDILPPFAQIGALAGLADSIESARQLQIPHASGAQIVCTYHPSAILRADPANAEQLRSHLVADLRRARELAA